ncbi:MerR family transcriptional regulator [Amycolatopsis anabasis]|uniref:MerR family transcriptional regulator n=1 Tax=Amycolatopsis anabasis TaxID=1840409 RepID=UPI00131B2397|nr:MerR family transcriptional regulator [Amycolatopsis anabasis]
MTGHGLTIGQAASFAGVTTKTVRHYHRLGLVDEPPRDQSGYRRYGSAELLQLVQARTLARAGLPLADIPELLAAEPDRFAATIAEVDRQLADHIAELTARRETLNRLGSGERALLPDRACALLDTLRRLDFGTETVGIFREGLVLAKALLPDVFDDYLRRLEVAFADPRYVDLIKRCWRVAEWEPDDPRIDDLAAAAAQYLLEHPQLLEIPPELRTRPGATRYGLVNHHRQEQAPSWARLTSRIEAHLRDAGITIPDQ